MSLNKTSLDLKGVSKSPSHVYVGSPGEENQVEEKLSKNQKRRKRRKSKIYNKIETQSDKIQKLENEIKKTKPLVDTVHASTQTAIVVMRSEIEFEAEELQKQLDQDHIQALVSEVVELKRKIAKINNPNSNQDHTDPSK